MTRGRVGIIGGGPAGLTAAVALRQVGWDVLVLERSPTLRTDGAGLMVQVNAMRMLAALGLADAVAARGVAIREAGLSTSAGRALSRSDLARAAAPLGQPCMGIHRAALSQVLADALPAQALRYGAAVESVDMGTGTVQLAGGESERFDLVLGADGLHSRVREAVVGPWPTRYAGYTCWRGVAPVAGPLGEGVMQERWGRGLRFGIVPIGPSQTYWFAVANEPQGGEDTDRRAHVAARFAHFGPELASLVAATDPDDVLRHDICDLSPLREWVHGRVVLIGDAGHATTPNLGQGACMAIEDGVTLAAALRPGDDLLPSARAWAASRRRRVQDVVRTSWWVGALGQAELGPLCWLRDTLTALSPDSVSTRQLARLWDVEVPGLA